MPEYDIRVVSMVSAWCIPLNDIWVVRMLFVWQYDMRVSDTHF